MFVLRFRAGKYFFTGRAVLHAHTAILARTTMMVGKQSDESRAALFLSGFDAAGSAR